MTPRSPSSAPRTILQFLCVLRMLFLMGVAVRAVPPASAAPNSVATIVEKVGQVEFNRAGATVWDQASTNLLLYPEDQLRTAEGARVVLRMSDQTLLRIAEFSHVQMPSEQAKASAFSLLRGLLYFFHRDKPGEDAIRTRTISAIVRGTEFSIEVNEADGTTLVSMFDGLVEMTNSLGRLEVKSGQQGLAAPGQPPRLTPILTVRDGRLIQWCLYYPGILNLADLPLSAEASNTFAVSMASYSRGDLLAAYTNWVAGARPDADAARLYGVAMRLAMGQVQPAEELLATVKDAAGQGVTKSSGDISPTVRVSRAFRRLIDLVRGTGPDVVDVLRAKAKPVLATEWLVRSLEEQKAMRLAEAEAAAMQAVAVAPDFGFGWARLGELEFAFGRVPQAWSALERSLELAPRNAQAHALKGFLLAAQNRLPEAIGAFDLAIALDGNLDNAWLGRGLCRIRLGRINEGRQDLQAAVMLNPHRAVLRSYLAKANRSEGDATRAWHELRRAMELDPNDPTAWLYSALLKLQHSRVNEAIDDFERAQDLNRRQTRGVVRSRLLLDQDRAVAGANLASAYLDAGMVDVSVREAVSAVNADYTSFRSHLLLANSYNALRDPYQINLRYETPWLSEYLVSTLLAPVGAGVLSPYISQQEYSRLFEQDGIHVASGTEYRSHGDWQQTAAQVGTFGGMAYALDGTYRSFTGYRPNSHAEQLTLSARVQEQLTPTDSAFVQAIYYDASSGDVAQYYRQDQAHPRLRALESQEPLLVAGYHHQWSERSHTLILASRFQDSYRVNDPDQPLLMLLKDATGKVLAVPVAGLPLAPLTYRSEFEGYGAEVQELWKQGDHTLSLGARFQGGTFRTRSDLGAATTTTFFGNNSITSAVPVGSPALSRRFDEDLFRATAYAYYQWQVVEPVLLTAGLAYDHLEYPRNFRNVPISGGQTGTERLLPKAGLTWHVFDDSTLRFAYTRSLGGVAFDQSFRLEPSQVAGFNQAYRSLIPESVSGSIAGARIDTLGVALDQRFASGTYVGVLAEQLSSRADRDIGTVDHAAFFPFPITAGNTPERLRYEERNLSVNLNQRLGRRWTLGARYRLSDAELKTDLRAIPDTVSPSARSTVDATLHEVDLYALFRHECGFFSQLDSVWLRQSNRHYAPDLPGDDFWQLNATAGWAFMERRLEVRTGVLNLTGRDYRLNPLNLTPEYPRQRTWFAGLRFYF